MDDKDEVAKRTDALERYGIMDTPPEAIFESIVHEASLLTGTPVSTITIVDDRRQWFKARVGVDRQEDPLADSICAVAMKEESGAFVVDDASVDERFRQVRGVVENGIRFYAGIPLIVSDGTRVGTLCVIDTEARAGLEEDEKVALQALARRTVAAMEMRRDLVAGGPAGLSNEAWLRRARSLLEQSAAALTQIGATAALAQLEGVIASLDASNGH